MAWVTEKTPPSAALQYKDLSNPTNAAAARQQMIMSSIKSPEHQQAPSGLAPSNSGRRKETATPEGEYSSSAAAFLSDSALVQVLICLNKVATRVNTTGFVELLLSFFFHTPFREKEGHFRK